MPRRTTSLALVLPPRPSEGPAYRWLYDAIRVQVVGGRLEPGCRLPSTRDLARQYGLSRGTVVAAFEMLIAEGYLESARGSGTRVSRAFSDTWRGRGGETHPSARVPAR
jgi:GntR family transcriptional regulator/MocR family aminotransferase